MNIEIIRTADPIMVFMGGACATNTADLKLEDVAIEGPHRDVIVVSCFLEEVLSDDEFSAIIQHETGHIVLGHLALMTEHNTLDLNGAKILDLPLMEIEADTYSADRCGPGAMLGALGNVVNWFCASPVLKNSMLEYCEEDELEEHMGVAKQSMLIALDTRIKNLTSLNAQLIHA